MKYCFQFNYTYDILTIMTKVKQMKNNSLNESKKKVRNLVAKTKQWNLIDRRKNSSQERFEDGQYFIIIIRPRDEFVKFKSDPVSGEGMLQQIHGQNSKKQWSTQSWLISKEGATVNKGKLVSTSHHVSKLLRAIGGKITKLSDDTFLVK